MCYIRWSDTTLHSAAASWIAYPADKPGVSSGNFSTSDVHSPTKPQLTNNKTISFPDAKKFKAVPQVFAAINAIDMDRKANFRVKVLGDDITDSGFTWHIDSVSLPEFLNDGHYMCPICLLRDSGLTPLCIRLTRPTWL